MRLLAACLLVPVFLGCAATSAVKGSATASTCELGNTIHVDFALADADNGRSITVHRCAVISVRLQDSQGIESSDDAVLAILPLPLPAPPRGGAYTWFQAKGTGSADLTSKSGRTTARWAVHVSVVP